MEKLSREAENIMIDRFGKDSIISLATTEDDKPYVRSVNSFYESGSFYVLTYGLSNKMKQITKIQMSQYQESGLLLVEKALI